MTRRSRLLLLILSGGGITLLDRLTKIAASERLQGTGVHEYLGGCFVMAYSTNTGAFLSLGAGMSPSLRFLAFVVLVGLVLLAVGVVYLLRVRLDRWTSVALALILAGGANNLYDRIVYDGVVVDFLNLGIGSVRTGMFNVADMAITAGVILVAVLGLRKERPATEPEFDSAE
jgi:signal peptidase II